MIFLYSAQLKGDFFLFFLKLFVYGGESLSRYAPSLSDVDSGVTEGAWKISGGSALKFTLLVFFLIVEGSERVFLIVKGSDIGTVKMLPSIPLANVIVLELFSNGFGETTGLLTCEISNWRTGF